MIGQERDVVQEDELRLYQVLNMLLEHWLLLPFFFYVRGRRSVGAIQGAKEFFVKRKRARAQAHGVGEVCMIIVVSGANPFSPSKSQKI